MEFPSGYLFTKDHEWAQRNGDTVTIGITDHAQQSLGDIVYVELPAVGRKLKAHETFGVVESIKAVSDLYSPISGEVVAVNSALTSSPETVNQSAHQDGWIIKLKATNPSEFELLMDAGKYKAFVESLK